MVKKYYRRNKLQVLADKELQKIMKSTRAKAMHIAMYEGINSMLQHAFNTGLYVASKLILEGHKPTQDFIDKLEKGLTKI